MMDLIQRFFSKDRSNRKAVKQNFTTYFFSQPEHQWLDTDECRPHVERLIAVLPSSLVEALMTTYPVSFRRSEEATVPGHVLTNTVVVFPEFQRLLRSKRGSAVAYLAHELAFVLWELEINRKDPLAAEISADKFVADLGLTFELEELLLMLDETVEKRVRLTYLTIHHFGGEN